MLPSYPQFVVFNGEVATYALNFADETEADEVRHHLQKRYEQETKGSKSISQNFFLIIFETWFLMMSYAH